MELELTSINMSFELSNGKMYSGDFTKIDRKNWNKIEKGSQLLMKLIDGNDYFIDLQKINKDGITFNYVGKNSAFPLFHKRRHISELFMFKSDK